MPKPRVYEPKSTIQLTQKQRERAEEIMADTGKTFAAVVREAIDALYASWRRKRRKEGNDDA